MNEQSNANRETALYHGHVMAAADLTTEDILRVISPEKQLQRWSNVRVRHAEVAS
jgi:hypothetical protein